MSEQDDIKRIDARLDAWEADVGSFLTSLGCRVIRLEAWRDGEEIEGAALADVPTERERQIHYHALEADYMEHHTPASIEKMDAALDRFKKLAGL